MLSKQMHHSMINRAFPCQPASPLPKLMLTASILLASVLEAGPQEDADTHVGPLGQALAESETHTRRFHEHVVLLAHPALEGRLPGSQGSELAEAVIARTFEQLGLGGAFNEGEYRQGFTFRQGGRFNDRAAAQIVEGFNVGAILPGQGDLATEWIVLGAHHDHLGRGAFGSRRGAGAIHEGADDNASGTAAILLAAEMLAARFTSNEDPDQDRRSLLFVTFSGEESGLNGSAFFAENPPVQLENVALMINVDMIGRIQNQSVSVSGVASGKGLELIVDSAAGGSLRVSKPAGLTSRSDHAEFYRRGVPVLFFTETIFPDEYHTPDDESWRINFTDGARAAALIAEVAAVAALAPQRPAYGEIEGFETGEDGPSLSDLKVRFGIKPGNYGDTEPGIAVAGVSADTSAEDAGLREGDRLLAWNGKPIEGVREWMLMMTEHEPGDVVTVTVIRDGEKLDLPVMLKPRS